MGNIYDEIKNMSMLEYSDQELVDIQDEVDFMLNPEIDLMNEEELFDAWIEFKIDKNPKYPSG